MSGISSSEKVIMDIVLGRRIIRIRPITFDESKVNGVPHYPDRMVLELENGAKLYASFDGGGRVRIYGEHEGRLFKI